jgi:hypothetical protein
MSVAPELGIVFLITFFAMIIAWAVTVPPLKKCDEYCADGSRKLICLHYKLLGYVDSCDE